MLVQMTVDDVRKGVRSSCGACPVAQALLRTFPGMACAYATKGYVCLTRKNGAWLESKVGLEVANFIDLFDSNYIDDAEWKLLPPPAPIAFEVSFLPDCVACDLDEGSAA